MSAFRLLRPLSARAERLVALAWSTVLALVLTWPMVLHPARAALGHVGADGMKHLWTLWWMRASVWQQGEFPFHTSLVNAPTGMDLFPIEPLGGLAAILTPGLDLVVLANLLVLINLILTGVAGAWMGRVLSGRAVGGFVAATLIEGSAAMAFFVHVGVGELQAVWWLPLGIGTVIKARRTGSWRWFLTLSAVLVGALLSSFYLGFFLGLAVFVWALASLGSPVLWPRLLPRYATAAALVLAVVLPITHVFESSYQSPIETAEQGGHALTAEDEVAVVDPPSARLELSQLLIPAGTPTDPFEQAYGGGRYLGWIALGMALVGLKRRRDQGVPLLAVAVVGVVLAMGSHLTIDGVDTTLLGREFWLPAYHLNRLLALVAEPINFPVRMGALTAVAVAGMASLAVRSWGALLAPLAVLEIALAGRVPRPWASFELPRYAALATVAELPPELVVVDLTFMARPDLPSRRTSLATQIAHQHPVNIVPIERVEFFARQGVWQVQALPLYEALRDALKGEKITLDDDESQDDAAATLALLQEAGMDLIMVHDGGLHQPMARTAVDLLTQLCGPPLVLTGAVAVWRVPQPTPGEEPDPADIVRWRMAHTAAMTGQSTSAPAAGRALR